MHRAYSILEIKAVREESRVIEGMATTPTPDRMGDIVDPMGAKFALPIPLLWQHNRNEPIGHVEFAKATPKGIPFKARIAKSDEPGLLKDRLDEAWHSIKLGLVRAVSIGFRALEHSMLKGGGIKFTSWEWLELSAVTIPAQSEANITTIKSIDKSLLAAIGRKPETGRDNRPGASGNKSTTPKGINVKTIAEQVSSQEAKRSSVDARMRKMMADADTAGHALNADEREEYDGLGSELDDCDEMIKRLAKLERSEKSAKPANGQSGERASASRGGIIVRSPVDDLPKGTRFARAAMAIAAGKGSVSDSLEYAKRWDSQTPDVGDYIKAVAGTSVAASPGWGSELISAANLASEFVELLRPATVMGRMTGLRRVPFNVRIPTQTGGSTVNWVGEAAVKPVTELAFSEITLGYNKIAGIVVLSEELVRLSTPSAEETVRRDLIEQIAKFMDQQFLDPTITATSTRPASITNGVTAPNASGVDADALYLDLNGALATFDTADMTTSSLMIIMPPALARGISTLRNALGQFEFSGLSVMGGTLAGFPAIVSSSAPAGTLIIVAQSEILLADDGQVRLDSSNQATLDMAGGGTPTYSLWQRNLVGLRAERWVTYAKRRAGAVAMIDTATYGPV